MYSELGRRGTQSLMAGPEYVSAGVWGSAHSTSVTFSDSDAASSNSSQLRAATSDPCDAVVMLSVDPGSGSLSSSLAGGVICGSSQRPAMSSLGLCCSPGQGGPEAESDHVPVVRGGLILLPLVSLKPRTFYNTR